MSNAHGESDVSPTESETTRTVGNIPRGSCEIPESSTSSDVDRSEMYGKLTRTGMVVAGAATGFTFGWVCGYLESTYSENEDVRSSALANAFVSGAMGAAMGALTGSIAPVFPTIAGATGLVGAAGYLFSPGEDAQRIVRLGCLAAGLVAGVAINRFAPKTKPAPIDRYVNQSIRIFLAEESGALGRQDNAPYSYRNPNFNRSTSRPGVGGKYHDAASRTNLRGYSLIRGTRALQKAGLIRTKGMNGAYVFKDPKTGLDRVKWVPRKGKEPPHWSKFPPSTSDQKQYLNNAGRPVSSRDRAHRIPSNAGGPVGGTGPGSPSPVR